MIRRLNKMENQRLGSRLDCLNAEVEQSRLLISQEQEVLRKQLTKIREVKGNPTVSIERRKLLRQISCMETRRQGLPNETQQRFRSLSTGDRSRGASLSPLPLVNGRSKSQSSNTPSEAWPDISTSASTRNTRPRQRSLSTGTYPRISAWEGIDKNGGVRDDVGTSTTVEKSGPNSGCTQEKLNLEFKQSPTWAWRKGKRRYTWNKNSATALSEMKINAYGEQKEGDGVMVSSQSSGLASTQRRQRSYSTNSAPTISEGRVLEMHKGEPSKTNTLGCLQSASTTSARQRLYSTNCKPKVDDGEVVDTDVPDDKNTNRNSDRQGVPVQLVRRQRSLSTNCPPVVVEGKNAESDSNKLDALNLLASTDDKLIRNSSSCDSELGNALKKHIILAGDVDLCSSNSYEHISMVGRRDGTENGISLPPL